MKQSYAILAYFAIALFAFFGGYSLRFFETQGAGQKTSPFLASANSVIDSIGSNTTDTSVPTNVSGTLLSASASTTIAVPTTNATNTAATIITATTSFAYEYKYLESADECTLNRYSEQGWSITQMGAIVTDFIGGPFYAADCKTHSPGAIDWVIIGKAK